MHKDFRKDVNRALSRVGKFNISANVDVLPQRDISMKEMLSGKTDNWNEKDAARTTYVNDELMSVPETVLDPITL